MHRGEINQVYITTSIQPEGEKHMHVLCVSLCLCVCECNQQFMDCAVEEVLGNSRLIHHMTE